jgi:hypothetical protein
MLDKDKDGFVTRDAFSRSTSVWDLKILVIEALKLLVYEALSRVRDSRCLEQTSRQHQASLVSVRNGPRCWQQASRPDFSIFKLLVYEALSYSWGLKLTDLDVDSRHADRIFLFFEAQRSRAASLECGYVVCTAALLLLYCCFTAALLLFYCGQGPQVWSVGVLCVLLLYCCFTAALLLLYCCFTAVKGRKSGEWVCCMFSHTSVYLASSYYSLGPLLLLCTCPHISAASVLAAGAEQQ